MYNIRTRASRVRYDLFISHAWSYSERYNSLINLLDEQPYFKYHNYSIPKTKAADTTTDAGLKKFLDEQIRQASVVIIISGMYVNNKEWIQYEIEEAKRQGKKLLGVRRRGEQRTPKYVKENVDLLVNWSGKSIVDGVRELCRK